MSLSTPIPKLEPQFITDRQGRRTGVVIKMKNWRKLQEYLEDLEDIRLVEESLSEETVPWEEVKTRLMVGDNRAKNHLI